MVRYERVTAALLFLLFACLPFVSGGIAAAQAVAQSYGSDTPLDPGMIVQLDPSNASRVSPATQNNAARIHGVVVSPNSTPVTLTQNSASRQVYVATSGNYQVLVSDQNGTIRTGDYISISAVAGVGMKANGTQMVVLGKALNDFDGSTNVVGITSVADHGHKLALHLGYVAVDISLSHNPLYQPTKSAQVNSFLQKFGRSIADKEVSLLRIYLSIGILLITALIAGALLYAGVRTGMVALGRNPLARQSIMHSLLQVVLTSLSVLLAGVFAVFLVLKL